MTKERDYQELYDRLLEEVSTLHRNNRRRIRVGMRMLLAVTLGLMLLMFLAGGEQGVHPDAVDTVHVRGGGISDRRGVRGL